MVKSRNCGCYSLCHRCRVPGHSRPRCACDPAALQALERSESLLCGAAAVAARWGCAGDVRVHARSLPCKLRKAPGAPIADAGVRGQPLVMERGPVALRGVSNVCLASPTASSREQRLRARACTHRQALGQAHAPESGPRARHTCNTRRASTGTSRVPWVGGGGVAASRRITHLHALENVTFRRQSPPPHIVASKRFGRWWDDVEAPGLQRVQMQFRGWVLPHDRVHGRGDNEWLRGVPGAQAARRQVVAHPIG